MESTKCPACRNGQYLANDCTGKTRAYDCGMCHGYGSVYADSLPAIVEKGKELRGLLKTEEEDMEWGKTEAPSTHGKEWAAGYVNDLMRNIRSTKRDLERYRTAYRALTA